MSSYSASWEGLLDLLEDLELMDVGSQQTKTGNETLKSPIGGRVSLKLL